VDTRQYWLEGLHPALAARTRFDSCLEIAHSLEAWPEQVRVGLKITMRVISLKITCRNIVLQSAAIALVNSFIPQPNILLHHPDIPAVTLQQVN
jgi:hypothetical protein